MKYILKLEKNWEQEMLAGEEKALIPPFAGIILFRFYGYDLSLRYVESTPVNKRSCFSRKCKDDYLITTVTFLCDRRSRTKMM